MGRRHRPAFVGTGGIWGRGGARYGRPPLGLVPLMLDHNLRNTRQIAEVFRPLAPT